MNKIELIAVVAEKAELSRRMQREQSMHSQTQFLKN